MSKITKEEVQHVAKLARLALTKEEEEQMTKDLGSILGYIDKLSEVDTKDVEPTAQVTGLESVFREDGQPHEPGAHTDKLLKQAPASKDDFIKVKGVLKK